MRKAVIPIAGFGTRFLPATTAVPKTLFPIIDKPAIHHLVEEAVMAGCEEIIIVMSRYQEHVKSYFQPHKDLEEALKSKDRMHLIADIHDILEKVIFHFVYQDEQLGDGHAILCADAFIQDEPFLVLFGDDIVDPPVAPDLVAQYNKTKNPVIALQHVDKNKVDQYGIIKPGKQDQKIIEVIDVVEKPKPEAAPSQYGVVGKYIVTPDIMEFLHTKPASHDGEMRLVEAFKLHLDANEAIDGYVFDGKRYDIGNKWGFVEATIDFALKRDGLKQKVQSYINDLAQK
jgi:UTP--glucose-1-phosphate uridylyltransferase